MIRKKRIKKNLKKIHSERWLRYRKVNNFISSCKQSIPFHKLVNLMFEDMFIGGFILEYKSLKDLIDYYSDQLTKEELEELNKLIL